MIKRLISIVLFAGVALAGIEDSRAQAATSHAASAATAVGVNEAKATAILQKDSIQVQLPLTAPAAAGMRMVSWLLSPIGTVSGETSVDLKVGSSVCSVVFPWPKDGHSDRVEAIGWHRIGYRLESGGVAKQSGILAVGAIAANLMELRMASAQPLVSGQPLVARIYAGNPITRERLRGVHLKASLAIDLAATEKSKTAKRTVVQNAVTDRNGEAAFTFAMPPGPGQSATLKVEGVLSGRMQGSSNAVAKAAISKEFQTGDRAVIQMETDKPLHKPGETVHLRALVFADNGRAAVNTGLTLKIEDPDSKTLLETTLTTNRFGIAAYDWKTGAQLAPGDYDASVSIDGSSDYDGEHSSTIRIQRYELPEFAVKAVMDSGYYLDGRSPLVHLHAGYLFGKPVAAGTVRVARAKESHWNRKTGKSDESEGAEQIATVDANGDVDVHLDVKTDFDELKSEDYERYTDLEYRAVVTDASTGRSEPRNFTVRLTKEPVHLYLDLVGGNDREGDYLLTTEYADGVPASAKVTLDWMDNDSTGKDSRPTRAASVITNRLGMARVHLRYPATEAASNELDIRLIAHDSEGRDSKLDDTVMRKMPQTIWIDVAHSILAPGAAIEAVVHGPVGSSINVDTLSETGLLAHQQVRMAHAAESVTIPASPGFKGVVTVAAFVMNADLPPYRYGWDGDAGYKSALYPQDRELKVNLKGLRDSYLPGATVDAGISVRGAADVPATGALGISVIDTAVEQRAVTEEEANDRWYGGNWWRQGGSVAGVSLDLLDRIDTTQPIPEDVDLAAEKLLARNAGQRIEMEAENDNNERNEYEALMVRDLRPLGDAVLQARPEHLPTTVEALQGIAKNARLDDSLLVDPWNTPYKAEGEVAYDAEVLKLISAGPDKRFGTADDFTIEAVRRNLFALHGERMNKLLRDAVDGGHALPGDVAELKEWMHSGGLDLDSVRDPNGKPYEYAIRVGQRTWSVQVSVQVTAQARNVIWNSLPFNYFAPTEGRMQTALRNWMAAGKAFPETEAAARQVFATAGIDFDQLHDPTGRPFEIRFKQMVVFTRVEQIKAGGSLESTSRPVTHMLHVIQILRAPEVATPAASAANTDIVAQFYQPVTEQSGSDLKPQGVDHGIFKGNTGAIGGMVTDQTGAAIQGAKVKVQNSAETFEASATTGENGAYLVPDLAPGLYTVQVAAKGFASWTMREVHVSVVSLTTVDVTLKVGAETTAVTVMSGEDAEVVTDNAEISTTVTGRNAAELIKMVPGVTFKDGKKVVTGPNGKATISEPSFTPRLRHVFEETAYWAPSLETNANGHASLHFNLPDSLTTWKLHALASTVDGRVGVIDQTFKTFQPFFVDLDAPQVLTAGDEITLPVNLRNYTEKNVTLPVTVKAADWFKLLTPPTVQATVAANGATPVIVGLRATREVEAGPLNLNAANARQGDAVEKTVRVNPDGEPRAEAASGLLRGASTTLALDLPANMIPGSLHANLLLYPNLGAHILHSMKAVLERPYGCGEQTISSTYPSLLFVELLKASKSNSPMEAQAETYLQLGYDRLLGYMNAAGGITYWGSSGEAPDPALTAYGIEFLSEAEPYIAVDKSRIVDAVDWLVTNQKADGSWAPHYGDSKADLNLYIASVLARAAAGEDFTGSANKELTDRVHKAVEKAVTWAATSAAAVHDPYANALRLRIASDPSVKSRLRAELMQTAEHDREGAYWSNTGYSPFYGWGHAGDLETTALVLAALREKDNSASEKALENDALLYLLHSQDRYGIWYSGQATVRVLQALLPMAIEQMKTPAGSAAFHLAVNGVALAGKDAEALNADPKLLEAPRSVDLTNLLQAGSNQLVFSNATETALASAAASVSYYVPWQETGASALTKTQTGKDAGLDFGYQCAAADAKVGQPVECKVDVRRFGSSSYGMLLAEVGLPPGADVDRLSLAKLMDSWTISRYELQPDRIVFYLWSWKAEGEHFSFRFTPQYAIRAKAAPATLSDYYNPDLRVVLAPQMFSVKEQPQN